MIDLGLIEEETFLGTGNESLHPPTVQLRDGLVDPLTVRLLPIAKAKRLCALVMFKVHDSLTVAFAEPQNLQHIDEIERLTGLAVQPVRASKDSIESAIERCYLDGFRVDAINADLPPGMVSLGGTSIDKDPALDTGVPHESPVSSLLNFIIVHALRQNASDIHIEPTQSGMVVRIRVDGQLRELLKTRRSLHGPLLSNLKSLANPKEAQANVSLEGRMHVTVEGRAIDIRVTTLPTIQGEKAALRILDRRHLTFNLQDLGMPTSILQELQNQLARPHGLILVTGPTGCGKTTTVYSTLQSIKSVQRNIVTVESPVEYQLELVNQVPIGPGESLSFSTALRSILRQDPDVIMVGEIRDPETAALAIEASLSGHLVISTMHSQDSRSAITRLRDMGIEPDKIAASLTGVIAQRLIRKNCPYCKTTYYPEATELESVGYHSDRHEPFHRGEGCRECYDSGFKGRQAIFELLTIDKDLQHQIRMGHSLSTIPATKIETGPSAPQGTRLIDMGLRLAESGTTSIAEVIRVAHLE